MLRDFWETATPAYRTIVIVSMTFTAAGILMTIIGANTQNRALMVAGLPFIGIGLILHVTGLVIRARTVRKRMRG